MICKNCGANVVRGLLECEYCGSPIVQTEIETFPMAQSFVSLLSVEESKVLFSYIAAGNHAAAQRLIMTIFGFSGQQAYDIIKQLIENKDAIVPNMDVLIKNLTPKTKRVLFFDEDSEAFLNAKIGAQKKYLYKLGYTSDEKILAIYDNAIIKTGEIGFVITNKGFYSSGSLFGEKSFYIPLDGVRTIYVDGSTLFVNDKKVDIVLIDSSDYFKVCFIVSRIIRSQR